MVSYELALLIRNSAKPHLPQILKRTANKIFENNGIIKRIDNLGERLLPYGRRANGGDKAEYFVIEFMVPPSKLEKLTKEYNRDVDILKNNIYKVADQEVQECTLSEEMKPAPYRPEVIKLIEDMKKKESKRPKFKYNTGLDYYPFQK